MSIKHQRLDKFISQACQINRKAVKIMLAQQRIKVDGQIVVDADLVVNKFSYIELDEQILQNNRPVYLMLHKPVGVVSSTKGGNINERLRKDNPALIQEHPTVIDLLKRADRHTLHYAGRLDLNTSGLMLLTNDSRWSERLSLPEQHVEKSYRVTLQNPLNDSYLAAFEQGIYLPGLDVTTRPAKIKLLSAYVAQVKITEGRHHQIKRMFGVFDNPVLALHREAIGSLALDENLPVGQSRLLTQSEVDTVHLNLPIKT